jgi:F-type H+-transporting ATPase subunit alpha
VETEAQNLSAYIPTNLISITDGQIYLSPVLAQKGVLPAVDVGRSVSRVGGKAQRPAYRQIAGDLRLSYAQFRELEEFSRFGTRLDEDTRRTLQHGRRVREVFKQDQYAPIPVGEQVAVLFATTEGVFDDVPEEEVAAAQEAVRRRVRDEAPAVTASIRAGEELTAEARTRLLEIARAEIQRRTAEAS